MKNLPIILLLASFSYGLASDDSARHKEWMDTAQDLTYDLKDALDAKSSDKSAEPAQKLIKLGEQEEDYWTKAKLENAVKLAQQSLALSRQIATEAKDGHFNEAQRDFTKLQTTCRTCHDLHFEKRLNPAGP